MSRARLVPALRIPRKCWARFAFLFLTAPLSADVLPGGPGLLHEVALNCRETGVDYALVYRLITEESCWNPLAVGHEGNGKRSLGLMQLYEPLLPWFSKMFNRGRKINPFNPRESIRIGVQYLAWLCKLCESWHQAAWSYNAGIWWMRRGLATKRVLDYIDSICGQPPRRQER